MTQDNVPRELRDGNQRIEEGLSDDDDDIELVEVLENVLEGELAHISDDDEEPENPDDESDYVPTPYIPLKDDSVHTYLHHNGSVFACDLHPDGTMIATGGEDDRMIVTQIPSGDIVFECKNHFQDSVTMVNFNHDGKYLLACDLSGQIAVWKMTAGTPCVMMEHIGGVTPSSWVKWHPKANIFLVGGRSIWLYRIPSGQCKLINENALESSIGDFMPDGKRAVIGFSDGTVKVFDLQTSQTLCKFAAESTLLDNILCAAVHPEKNLIAVGSMNAKLGLFTAQQPKTVGVLDCIEDERSMDLESSSEDYQLVTCCEAVLFVSVDGMNVIVVATDNYLHIWDYARLTLRHKIHVEEGITRMLWAENSLYLYVGTRLGPINVYNPLSGEKQPPLDGNKTSIFELAMSKDKRRLITAADDGSVKVFDISHHARS